MAKVLSISDAGSIALHAMVILAADQGRVATTSELASIIDVSEAHLSKILQRLARARLVESIRGPKGGYRITEKQKDITLLDIYEAIEGPLKATDCLLKKRVCDGRGCILGGLLKLVNMKMGEYLGGTRLVELAKAFSYIGKEQVN
jgi:Rrf2 family protein